MDERSVHKPVSLNLDKGYKNLTPNESFFMRGHELLLAVNNNKGNNSGIGRPMPANYPACDKDQPAGENYNNGSYRSPITGETYSWIYNHNGANYIERISPTQGCQIVYDKGCLTLNPDPKHSIEPFRANMRVEKVCPYRDGKYLIWTDGDGEVGCIDVEASIATNGFTTPFFDVCADPCSMIRLCVPDPCGCLVGEFVSPTPEDAQKTNAILDSPIQFMYKHIYYDQRESLWSDRSTVFYQNTKGCFDSTSGFPRCIKLRIPIGNPMVEKIKVAFTLDGQNWYVTETVDKYQKYNSSQQKWYERELSESLMGFSEEDCAFDYYFCNDKGKEAVPPAELIRVRNPIPRKPQGMIEVKDSLGFYNYEDGVCPIDEFEAKKFNIDLNCSDENQCSTEFVTITGRAIVHNRVDNLNAFVHRQKGGDRNAEDDITDTAHYGGIKDDFSEALGFGQEFKDKTRNFIAYVDGSPYWAEMVQWRSDPGFTNRQKVDIISGMEVEEQRAAVVGAILASGQYYFQEFKIKVPKGAKGFLRIASQKSTNGADSAQNTSTSVIGTVNLNDYTGVSDVDNLPSWVVTEEIPFDACNGDVTLDTAFIIDDMAAYGITGVAFDGYIKDPDGNPLEGLNLYFSATGDLASTTDHNGYYHAIKNGSGSADLSVRGEKSCSGETELKVINAVGAEDATTTIDATITDEAYLNTFYATVKVPVQSCANAPVSGVRVSLSGTKYKVTNGLGEAIFKIRNYASRDRVLQYAVINMNGCFTKNCDGNCPQCMPVATAVAPECFFSSPEIIMATAVINPEIVYAGTRGLKPGGRYPLGFVVKGNCGRQSGVYHVKYLDIPRIQEVGSTRFCGLRYMGNGITLPSWADCLKIVRGVNLNPYELQWKVDKVERTADGKIRLTIQSLNDYNIQHNLQTNTVYQYLKGDRIEFIKNGDGSVFSLASYGLLNYQILSPYFDQTLDDQEEPPANYFNQLLITDDGRLSNLTEGAIIELQRPNENTMATIYYEICASIPVEDGQLVYPVGDFETFDTFLVSRTIGSFTDQFNHFSPSDFWGNRVSDIGKAHVKNEFETERRFGRNMTINSPTIMNYFGDLVKRFDAPGQGDITAMGIKDGRIITAICENDNFTAEVSDELVRVGSDGIIRALPPDQIVSDAQPKISGEYGCQYHGIGSVYFGDGYTKWIDTNNRADIIFDYSSARNVSLGKTESYFRVQCQKVAESNHQDEPINKLRYVTGWNQSTKAIYTTIKSFRDNGFNNTIHLYDKRNETIIYHPGLDDYLGFAHFTPERMTNVDLLDENGCSFVSYINGLAYIHPVISDKYNEFYGIAGDEMVGITINEPKEKIKRALSCQVQSDMMWFVKEVTSDKVNFLSEIPPKKMKLENRLWNGSFLFNINSKGGLFGSDRFAIPDDTRGTYINVLFMRDQTDNLKYLTVNPAKQTKYSEIDNILIKFAVVEQTGITENL